jgi:hypothetical protein
MKHVNSQATHLENMYKLTAIPRQLRISDIRGFPLYPVLTTAVFCYVYQWLLNFGTHDCCTKRSTLAVDGTVMTS